MWQPKSRFSSSRSKLGPVKPWLEGFSYVAQVCAVVLAWYGYVHTVLPVFQKEKLEEDLARLQLEEASEKTELERLRRLQAAADEGLKKSLGDVAVARSIAQRAQEDAHRQSIRALSLAKQNDAYEGMIRTAEGSIIALQWNQFAQRLGISIAMSSNTAYSYYEMAPWLRDGPDKPPPWPDPVADAMMTIEEIKASVPLKYRDSIDSAAKAYILEHQNDLACPAPAGFVPHEPGSEKDPVRDAARSCSRRVGEFGERVIGLNWVDVSKVR